MVTRTPAQLGYYAKNVSETCICKCNCTAFDDSYLPPAASIHRAQRYYVRHYMCAAREKTICATDVDHAPASSQAACYRLRVHDVLYYILVPKLGHHQIDCDGTYLVDLLKPDLRPDMMNVCAPASLLCVHVHGWCATRLGLRYKPE